MWGKKCSKKNQTIKLLTILLTILLFSLTVNALGTATIDAPAADETITNTPSINITIANAGGPGVENVTFYYRTTANTSNQLIGLITNSSENQTSFKINLTTTALEDSTIELIVNVTYNNGTLAFSDTNTGIIINNNQVTTVQTLPADGTVTDTRTQSFTATTSEEVSSLRFIISNIKYSATGTSDGKTWTATVDNLNPTLYNWNVETTDQGDSSTIVNAPATQLLTIQSSSTTIMKLPSSQEQKTSTKMNPGLIIGIIIFLYFVFRKKNK